MRDEWREAFTQKARAHWTPERVEELTGGKDLLVLPNQAPALLRALGEGLDEEFDGREAPGAFAPIWQTPQLCRETAATMTDTFRTLLLRAAGYDTRAVEFVPSEHTPKNTLIRAIRRDEPGGDAWVEYVALRDATGGVGIKLEGLLAICDL
ncbi:MAG: hypothetical protein ACLFVJ_02785 [Persicimonas sp.]